MINKSKIIVILFTVLLLLSFNPFFTIIIPVKAADTDYYVKNGGNDALSGLDDTNAWETMAKVNAMMPLVSGDNIYFKYGDSWTDATSLTLTGFSGTSGDKAILGAYGTPADGLPRFHNNSYGIYTDNNHNITIQNLRFENMSQRGIEFLHTGACSNIIIENCEIVDVPNFGVHIQDVTTGYFLNNTVERCGSTNEGGLDGFQVRYSSYFLVQNNTIVSGPLNDHANLIVRQSDYVIVRDNIVHSDGNIALDDTGSILVGYTHMVIEDNEFYDVKGAAFKTQGNADSIWRNNIIYNTGANGLSAYINTAQPVSNNVWYHNTIYDIGDGDPVNYDGAFHLTWYDGDGRIRDNIIKNNIIHTANPAAVGIIANGGDPDPYIYDNLFDTNMIYNITNNYLLRRQGVNYNLASAESTYPDLFKNTIEADPLFANAASYDFELNSTSPAIDAAAWLTTCNGSDTGTAITVHDARYFCDGFGLITGDEITVGTDDVTITDINYGTNVLTITPSITWVDDDNVSLRYNGDAPDIGAEEYTEPTPSEPPTSPSNLDDVSSTGDSVSLEWIKGYIAGTLVHDILFVDNFTKYGGNPIFDKTDTGAWADYGIRENVLLTNSTGHIVKIDGDYVMYFNGRTSPPSKFTRVGRATSTDGIAWDVNSSHVFNDSAANYYTFVGSVIQLSESSYIMYYSAKNDSDVKIIKYATSTNSIVWTAQSEVLNTNEFTNAIAITIPYVTYFDGEWHMVMEGDTATGFKIFYANSSDGLSWTATADAIYEGSSGEWDDEDAANPQLFKLGTDKYVIFYNGNPSAVGYDFDLGVIYSNDVTSGWTSWKNNPILVRGAGGTWDDTRIEGPRLYMDDINNATLRMWYFGLPTTGSFADGAIGYATCSDTITNTMVRYSTSDNLSTYADGSLGYNGTNSYATITGLNSNTTYYFRAWSWNETYGWNSTGSNTVSSTSSALSQWVTYYGDGAGTNFTINTFDVVKIYLNDGAGTITFNMTANQNIDYSAGRTVNLTKYDYGYNFTGWIPATSTTLSDENTSIGLSLGYFMALWNETTFGWNFWISHFGFMNKNIHQYDVIMTKISQNRSWTQP